MKLLKCLLATTCAVAFLVGSAMAAEKTCCQKAIDKGEKCTHPCCVEAGKEKKVCEKCNKGIKDCCADAIKKNEKCKKCESK